MAVEMGGEVAGMKKGYLDIEKLTNEGWLLFRNIHTQNSIASEMRKLEYFAAPDVVEVVRCKDCKHRPYSTEPGKTYGLTIEAPDDRCPCYNEDDGWYSWVPDNEFFCFYGERKEGEE